MNSVNHKHSHVQRIATVICVLALLIGSVAQPARAQLLGGLLGGTSSSSTRLIVRDSLGLVNLLGLCSLLGCTVQYGLGDPQGELFLVTTNLLNVTGLIGSLKLNLGIVDVELDQPVHTLGAYAGPAPSYLSDTKATSYYGTSVWHGYLAQTPNALINTAKTQSTFKTTGYGVTVAVIDTGVDPNQPVLKPFLVTGYDFTRNASGGSEMKDVSASPNLSNTEDGQVSQSTVAVLDQSTVAVLDGNGGYAAFGHGTMTAGLVHLVAPQAKIMPLKAFTAAGSGYDSDVLRAVYYAVKNGAKVLNMSFEFSSYSPELANAVSYAYNNGVISVASAGNDGQQISVYPASLPHVINVASTNNSDVQSSFTNYGAPPVTLAAPGEAVMSTYPWGTYAAGWGTSFSNPLAAGTVAMMLGKNGSCTFSQVPTAINQAHWISDAQLGYKRLDTYSALQYCATH